MNIFRSRDNTITAEVSQMQARLMQAGAYDAVFYDSFFNDRARMRALLESLLNGFEPSFEVLDRIHHMSLTAALMEKILVKRARVEDLFGDDTVFTNQRFYLLSGGPQDVTSNWSTMVFDEAVQQMLRMLEVGRVDMRYARHMLTRAMGAQWVHVAPILFAHDDSMLSRAQGRDASNAIVSEAVRLRERLFVERWLPAQVAAVDWVEAQQVVSELLRGLYPQVWAAGYEGYRQAVAGLVALPAGNLTHQ